jgi:hypothetical protein
MKLWHVLTKNVSTSQLGMRQEVDPENMKACECKGMLDIATGYAICFFDKAGCQRSGVLSLMSRGIIDLPGLKA